MTRMKAAGWLLVFSIWGNVAIAGETSTFTFKCTSPAEGKTPAIRLGATASKEHVNIGQWNVPAAMMLGSTTDTPALSVSLKSYHVDSTNMFLGLESQPGAPKKIYLAFWLPTAIESMTDGNFNSGPYTDLTLYQDDGETKDLVFSGIQMNCSWSSVETSISKPSSPFVALGADFMNFVRSLNWPSDVQ